MKRRLILAFLSFRITHWILKLYGYFFDEKEWVGNDGFLKCPYCNSEDGTPEHGNIQVVEKWHISWIKCKRCELFLFWEKSARPKLKYSLLDSGWMSHFFEICKNWIGEGHYCECPKCKSYNCDQSGATRFVYGLTRLKCHDCGEESECIQERLKQV